MRAVSNQVWATEEERPFSFGMSSFWPKLDIWPTPRRGLAGASAGTVDYPELSPQIFTYLPPWLLTLPLKSYLP